MSKSTPKAPDYAGAAKEQAASSRAVTEQQTWANRPDQYTPFGSQEWTNEQVWDPATNQYLNRWRQDTNLTPDAQAALDSQLRLQRDRSQLGESLTARMQNEYGQAMDWGGFAPMAETPQGGWLQTGVQGQQYTPEQIQRQLDTSNLQNVDPSQRYYGNAGDAIYGQWASRAIPQQSAAMDSLRTQLYNQGFKEGDPAFDNEIAKLRMQQGDAMQQASYQATIGAGQEAQRMHGMDIGTRGQQFQEAQGMGGFANQAAQQALGQQLAIGGQNWQQDLANANMLNQMQQQQYGQELSSANYQNQLRQQQIAEAMQQRGFSLNEINALLTGQQVAMPSMPGFSQAQRSEGLQSLQAANMQHQANMDVFGAQQAAQQGMMSGIGSLAGGFMMGSDRRIKKNVRRIGTTPGGTPLYSFRYVFGGPQRIGVMADEAPADAVINIGGLDFVDYSKVA